jgi:hypothetical protein
LSKSHDWRLCALVKQPREIAAEAHIGDQMINFHRPVTWQRESFTLRAPAAKAPCGDLCFVWDEFMIY